MTAAAQSDVDMPRVGAPPLVWIAFGAVGLFKLALLAIYGPIYTPDSAAYVAYADAIRASNAWMHDAGLSSAALPILAMRTIGYPAVIAGAMALFGHAWPFAVLALQYALSFAASYAVYRLALELGFSPLLSLAAVVAEMLSLALTYDQCILTDSLNTSIVILAMVMIVLGASRALPLSLARATVAGVALACAFLVRDAMQVLVIALLPLLAARIWLHGISLWQRSLACSVLMLAPLAVSVEAYESWNAHRTGERFVTTVAQVTFLHGLAKIAPFDPKLLSGDTPVDRVGRELFRVDPFGESTAANNELFQQGYKATDIARMAFATYFRSWRERPLTMLRLLQFNTSERVAKLSVRPIAATCEVIEFATGARQCYEYRDLYRAIPSGFRGYPPSALIFFAAQTVELTIAIGIFAAFFVGTPVIACRRLIDSRCKSDPTTVVLAAFWAVYVAWYMAFGLIHIEDRYMAPVLPLSLLGGLYVWREFGQWLAQRKRAIH